MPRPRFNAPSTWLLVILLAVVAYLLLFSDGTKRSEVSYDFFRRELQADNVVEVEIADGVVYGKFKTAGWQIDTWSMSEETIDEHYADQARSLGDDEASLRRLRANLRTLLREG